jgi:hypothetical protein
LTTLPFFCRGISIQPPQVLSEIQEQLDQVLLASPSVDDLTSGRACIDALRPVAIEDLLGQRGF